jgi:hypothetical protein
MKGLHGYRFWLGNPNPKVADMSLKVRLPKVLTELGWNITLRGAEARTFKMKPGEKRELVIEVHPGRDFGTDVIEKTTDRDIKVHAFADGALIGGMTYRIDPAITEPYNAGRRKDCASEAERLLECLDIHGKEVSSVKIKEITVGIKLKKDPDCSC